MALSIFVCAQGKQIKVDSFYSVIGFDATLLLLTSDNSFFIAQSNCTESNVARGKWKMEKGAIKLLASLKDSNLIIPKITDGGLSVDDTSVIFKITDYFSNPFPNYAIILFDKKGKEHNCYSDSAGILKVNKNRFESFFTYDEMFEFDLESGSIYDSAHRLHDYQSGIQVQLNYPKEMWQRQIVTAFDYPGCEFIKTRKGLKYKSSGVILVRQ